jgi:quercetin dioxygenase-like cupin family protein
MAKPLYQTDKNEYAELPDVIPVVPGATVSKALIDTGPLKQILFSMDAGQEISEHRAPFAATVQLLDGNLRFTVAGRTHDMKAGSWLLMPPNEPHRLLATGACRFLLTLIKEPRP